MPKSSISEEIGSLQPAIAMPIPETKLATGNSRSMPCIALGTASEAFAESTIISDAVLGAIKLGYRHFDTAALYQSEQSLGQAIDEALRLKLINSRDELFVTTKLWISDTHSDRVVSALRNSLKNLQLDYVDLYLIHYPVSLKPGEFKLKHDKADLIPMDFEATWKAMEQCQELGLTQAIGVSNFSCEKLEKILSTAKIAPAVNQVEMHPMWRQNKLRSYCKDKGIHICAYSPLGGYGTSWGTNDVLGSEALKTIAENKGKSVAQVCLRWLYEQGVTPVVKSFNEVRMKANLQLFDWALTGDDHRRIDELPQRRIVSGSGCTFSTGPYKSIQELWDGDV